MADIYFRTDGNREIATGHLMRCLTIARACAKKGASAAFVLSDEESLSLLRERFLREDEFPAFCLHSDYAKMEEEPSVLIPLLWQRNSAAKPWFFIDSYFVSPAYFAMLSPYSKVAYLDDLQSFDCNVDLVINYDSAEECPFYQKASRKLLGAQYTPLREQFQNAFYEVRPAVQNIFISTGGTDHYGVAEKILRAAFGGDAAQNGKDTIDRVLLQTFHYHILAGRTNSYYDILRAMSVENSHIHIHENVSDMASLMASCDLAVSAGGTTLCELCAVGVPAVSYLIADNQKTAAETYAKKGLIPCAGDMRFVQTPAFSHILSFLTRMSQNVDLRKKSSHAMRAFIDGYGAEKIAGQLLDSL